MKNFFYILLTAILLLSVCGKDKKENNMQSVKIQYVKTENFEMQYARFGSGEKTIVLFPGTSNSNLAASKLRKYSLSMILGSVL